MIRTRLQRRDTRFSVAHSCLLLTSQERRTICRSNVTLGHVKAIYLVCWSVIAEFVCIVTGFKCFERSQRVETGVAKN